MQNRQLEAEPQNCLVNQICSVEDKRSKKLFRAAQYSAQRDVPIYDMEPVQSDPLVLAHNFELLLLEDPDTGIEHEVCFRRRRLEK